MSNPEENKCSTITHPFYCGCLAKLSPSQSCEHDKGDHWRGITSLATKKEYPDCCPYCKPTAVEPSVEEIARSVINIHVMKNVGDNESMGAFSKGQIISWIAEALRNERNRK